MAQPQLAQLQGWYDLIRKGFTITPLLFGPLSFVVDAPFGRFTPQNQNSIWLVDGIKSWMAMELVSPLSLLYAFTHSPLSATRFGSSPPLTLAHPPTLLAALYLMHYLNRAIASPLRTPSRSKSHIVVSISAVTFNLVNGSIMGAYLSSPAAEAFLAGAFSRPLFWLGVVMWALGFAGNILHDEILLDLRRSARSKGKARADDDNNNGKAKGEHYAIPYGYLYKFISYPNYFCEWAEWLGFALAASPPPSLASVSGFLQTITPPFVFVFSEVLLMMPRAYNGHKWYLRRFPDYPKERKVVFPFIF